MTLHVVPDHHDPDERFYGSEGPPVRKFHVTLIHEMFVTLITVDDYDADHAFDQACDVMAEYTNTDVEFWANLKAEVDDEYGGITNV
jgi:hypothetical protein